MLMQTKQFPGINGRRLLETPYRTTLNPPGAKASTRQVLGMGTGPAHTG